MSCRGGRREPPWDSIAGKPISIVRTGQFSPRPSSRKASKLDDAKDQIRQATNTGLYATIAIAIVRRAPGAEVAAHGSWSVCPRDRRRAAAAQPPRQHPKKPPRDDEWLPAMLTEYLTPTPESEQAMEGAASIAPTQCVITVQQHRKDKAKYPYVSVSSDTVLR